MTSLRVGGAYALHVHEVVPGAVRDRPVAACHREADALALVETYNRSLETDGGRA